MNLVKKQRENRYRLGELFLETGLVDVSAVSEGLSIAKRTSFPIGRVLVMTGWLDDHDVNCALELQGLLREGTIDNSLAKDLLRFCQADCGCAEFAVERCPKVLIKTPGRIVPVEHEQKLEKLTSLEKRPRGLRSNMPATGSQAPPLRCLCPGGAFGCLLSCGGVSGNVCGHTIDCNLQRPVPGLCLGAGTGVHAHLAP